VKIRQNQFNNDLLEMLRLSDQRKRENQEARRRCQANAELVAILTAAARRRGRSDIDWEEYFRNAGI